MLFIMIFMAFFGVSGAFDSHEAQAAMFDGVRFVNPGEFAISIEPEFVLRSPAGLGGDFRYTQGISDLSNLTVIAGIGNGTRQSRIGADYTFDFFPDLEGQPGIGIALQGLWVQVISPAASAANLTTTVGQLELTAIPYLHKNFKTENGGEVEPFMTLPFGWAFLNGGYQQIMSVGLGGIFKANEHFRYTLEFTMAVNNTDSTVSGGVIYYH